MSDTKLDILNSLLLEALLADLEDPSRCSPGLYQVIRGYINDNRIDAETIPSETIEFLEQKMSDAIPFKKGA